MIDFTKPLFKDGHYEVWDPRVTKVVLYLGRLAEHYSLMTSETAREKWRESSDAEKLRFYLFLLIFFIISQIQINVQYLILRINACIERAVRCGVNAQIWKFDTFKDYFYSRSNNFFGSMKPIWADNWVIWSYAEENRYFGPLTSFGNSLTVTFQIILIPFTQKFFSR